MPGTVLAGSGPGRRGVAVQDLPAVGTGGGPSAVGALLRRLVPRPVCRLLPLTAHVGYQLVEVGYNVLLSVEPSCLDEPHRTARGIKVGG